MEKAFASLFGVNLCYAVSSTAANWAIAHKPYYSGSLYDIPLVAPMAYLTWIGLRTKAEKPDFRCPRGLHALRRVGRPLQHDCGFFSAPVRRLGPFR